MLERALFRSHPTRGGRTRSWLAAVAALSLLVAGLGAGAASPQAAAAEPLTAAVSVTVVVGDESLFSDVQRHVDVEVYDAADATAPLQTVSTDAASTGDPFAGAAVTLDLAPGAYRLRAIVDGAASGWFVDRLPSSEDLIFEEFASTGFNPVVGFDDATVLVVSAEGTATAQNALIAVHPVSNSLLGGVFSESADAVSGAFIPLDPGALMEVFPVGAVTPIATGEAGANGVVVVGDLPPGDYQVRLTGDRTVTPETGPPYEEAVAQWWPMQAARASARTVTIPQAGGNWVGITANLATSAFGDTGPGERAEIDGVPAVDLTIGLAASLDLGEGTDELAARIAEYDLHLTDVRWFADGVPITGATNPTLKLTPDLEGASLHAEFTSYLLFGAIRENASTNPVVVQPSPLTPLNPAPTPTIAGSPTAGVSITATVGSWGPGATTRTYQWLRDGDPIPGATALSYTPVGADVGSPLAFAVTASKPGYATTLRVSAPTDAVAVGTLTGPVPTIKGTLRVGSPPLTVAVGTWQPAPVSLSYQWLRNGEPIDGATASTLTLGPDDVGATIAVRVTGEKPGFTTLTLQSAATTAILAGKIANSVLPSIAGTAQVGQVLTASPGIWTPTGVAFAYQWLRAGVPVPGAVASTYTLTTDDRGKAIKVTVTASMPGYTSLAKTSSATPKVVP